jgi:hypothetical protein
LSFPNADIKQNVKHFVQAVSNPSGKKASPSGGGGSSGSNVIGYHSRLTCHQKLQLQK